MIKQALSGLEQFSGWNLGINLSYRDLAEAEKGGTLGEWVKRSLVLSTNGKRGLGPGVFLRGVGYYLRAPFTGGPTTSLTLDVGYALEDGSLEEPSKFLAGCKLCTAESWQAAAFNGSANFAFLLPSRIQISFTAAVADPVTETTPFQMLTGGEIVIGFAESSLHSL